MTAFLIMLVVGLFIYAAIAYARVVRRENAIAKQRLDDQLSIARSRYQVFNVDRARNHYALSCADPFCECANSARARGYAP